MARRCLICANINPCSAHSDDAQRAELRRNDETIAAIRSEERISRLATLHVEREEIGKLTLCGSTKFRADYELWNKRLTLAGFLVYSVSGFGHSGDTFTPEQKARLDKVHLAKIDASHAIVVINPGGYIGESTRREIEHARANGKVVYFTDQGGPTVYQLRTGSGGPSSMQYQAFDFGASDGAPLTRQDGTAQQPLDEQNPSLLKAEGGGE